MIDGYDRAVTARTPLIIDVDTGIDDSLALLYAAASPDAELIAVTVPHDVVAHGLPCPQS